MLTREIPLDIGLCAVPLPVIYVHAGHAIVTGTNTGKVRIWDADDEVHSQIQKLPHGMPHSTVWSDAYSFHFSIIDEMRVSALAVSFHLTPSAAQLLNP